MRTTAFALYAIASAFSVFGYDESPWQPVSYDYYHIDLGELGGHHGHHGVPAPDYMGVYGSKVPIPRDAIVDVINDLGIKLLSIHNEHNENNIAISPYGAFSVLAALSEGLRGDAAHEILHAARIPNDKHVIRVGLRDVHRHLKSYFIPEEGFLAGLTLNLNNVTLRGEYEEVLHFYGFDYSSFNNALYPEPPTTKKPSEATTLETGFGVSDATTIPSTSKAEETTTESLFRSGGESTESPLTTSTATFPTTTESKLTTATPLQTTPQTETTTIKQEVTTISTESVTESTSMSATTEQPKTTTEVVTTIITTTESASPETTTLISDVTVPTTENAGTSTKPPPPETTTLMSEVTGSTTENAGTSTKPSSTETTTLTSEITVTTTEKAGTSTKPSPTETTTLTSEATVTTTENAGTSMKPSLTETTTLTSEATVTTTENAGTSMKPSPTETTTLTSEATVTTTENAGTSMKPSPTETTTLTSEATVITTENAGTSTKPSSTETTTLTSEVTVTTTENVGTSTKPPPTEATTLISEVTVTTIKATTEEIPETTTTLMESTTVGNVGNTVRTTREVAMTMEPQNQLTTMSPTQVAVTPQTTETTTMEDLETTTPLFFGTTPDFQDMANQNNFDFNYNYDANSVPPAYDDNMVVNNVTPDQPEGEGFNNNFKRSARSIVDYVIARFYDDHHHYAPPPQRPQYVPQEPLTFAIYGKYRESGVNFMKYDTVLPYFYVPNLSALALSFPLDSTKYYLLLLLPLRDDGVDQLICDLRLHGNLRYIIDNLRLTHVIATIPSFMLKGYVTLTPALQRLGIRKIFEPRQADFSPMTNVTDIYVTNIEQAVTVTIRNYLDPSAERYKNFRRYPPVQFKADHPFLYFVIDSELHVALMVGKVLNPLNSRIR